ncbi:MAG: aminoacyl-tRNA hydrolase [Gammaproteobacteria bacterium]
MATGEPMRLIVGLGNPGPDYDQTRHNAGFWFVDELARRHGASFQNESRFHGEACRLTLNGRDLRLLKPMTFMNRSGQSIGSLARFFKIPVEHILVVHDELDLPPGSARLKKGGGHGGHNGLRDSIAHLGKDFARLRIGIGHPGHKDKVVGFVLNRPGKDELPAIERAIDSAADAAPDLVAGDWDKAVRELHSSS